MGGRLSDLNDIYTNTLKEFSQCVCDKVILAAGSHILVYSLENDTFYQKNCEICLNRQLLISFGFFFFFFLFYTHIHETEKYARLYSSSYSWQ